MGKIGIILVSGILVFCIGGCSSQIQAETTDRVDIASPSENQAEEKGTPCDSGMDEIKIYDGNMEPYYGTYEIREFVMEPVSWSSATRFDEMPVEEVNLLEGKKIIFSEDLFMAYDNYRYHGTSKLINDYFIQKYIIENPSYKFAEGSPLSLRAYTNLLSDEMEKILSKPYRRIQLKECLSLKTGETFERSTDTEQYGNEVVIPTFYVMDGERLLWEVGRTGTCFIIEKISDVVMEDELEIPEACSYPEEIDGEYEVVKFYPSIYWENREAGVEKCMSEDDTAEMIGKKITLKKDYYQGYIFDSAPYFFENCRNDPKIVEVSSEQPEYSVKEVKRTELYGLKDPIVPEEYRQDAYKEIEAEGTSLNIEIEIFYGSNAKYYVLEADQDKLLMEYMKEFFLLEKCE